MRGPKLDVLLEVGPHQCQVQGDNHFPSPASHTIRVTSQDAVGLLDHLGTLLAHVQPRVDQHPQGYFCQAALQPLFPKRVALHGVVLTQVQDPAIGLIESHTIGLSPLIQPVQIPLQSHPTLDQVDTPTNLVLGCQSPLMTGRQLDLIPFTTTVWAWPSSQFFNQSKVLLSKPWAVSPGECCEKPYQRPY
ncbi:hypothetical protein llap_9314 [Limosa lapponica baueri]|uniref:Uncharacterized protein n=1 Tax=Limosa lapponica baueri TaxID=1758121 RepID=A0A2I0U343_LIMLA|nr:hypothetical protein llap_9314 [Limosa lapponica baueri]